MQLYLYDLGTIDGWKISTDGLFGDAEKREAQVGALLPHERAMRVVALGGSVVSVYRSGTTSPRRVLTVNIAS